MQQTWLVGHMQIEHFGFVDFHALDVVPDYFVGPFDVVVACREVDVTLGEIGGADNQVFVSSDE